MAPSGSTVLLWLFVVGIMIGVPVAMILTAIGRLRSEMADFRRELRRYREHEAG